MTILDKIISTVSPPESDEARRGAHAKARAAAAAGSWLGLVLEHHQMIEDAVDALSKAASSPARRLAERTLATLLTAHSGAEESVLYPALARSGEKAHSEMAYVEQSAAKVQLAGFESLDPTSQNSSASEPANVGFNVHT